MAKNNNRKSPMGFLGPAALLTVLIFLVVYMLTLLGNSSDFFTASARKNAQSYFDRDHKTVEKITDVHFDNLYDIADRIQYATSQEEVAAVMSSYIGSDLFGNLRFFSQGQAYTVAGDLLNEDYDRHSGVLELAESKKQGCTAIYRDTYSGYDCIAFFVPVRGSAVVDGVLSIIQARNIIPLESALGEKTSVALLVDKGGTVLTASCTPEFDESVGNDLYEFLAKLTTDKTQINPLIEAIGHEEAASGVISTPRGEYIATLAPVDNLDNKYVFFTLCKSEALVGSETEYIRHVVVMILISMAFLTAGVLYALSYRRKMRRAMSEMLRSDPLVGCPNLEQFKNQAAASLRERQRRYAVCALEIRQYQALTETLTGEELAEVLQNTAREIEKICGPREVYGYVGEGKFVHLMAYAGEKSVKDRTGLIEIIGQKDPVLGRNKTNKKFNIGVSVVRSAQRNTIEELLDQANLACSRARRDANQPYEIYTEQVNAERQRNEQIEAQMEAALENGDFRLFLQPKYNIAQDCLEGAEALVRWFDPSTGDYRFPGEFLNLFESNGFIIKLDQFMYIEALKNLSASLKRGDNVFPISVNVSLRTVLNADFLDFYVENKKLYEIPDGLICVELTENFTKDDLHQIRFLVTQLRKNGIPCSLDNFGVGAASLSVLKNIPLDEIKMDRMFILDGIQKDRDRIIMETMVHLARSLGIRVVQQGVETKEMLDNCAARGCDAIQGYYYAKAISAEEYRLFTKGNTSIKYKAQVK